MFYRFAPAKRPLFDIVDQSARNGTAQDRRPISARRLRAPDA
jgi:hypothetical protein